AVAALLGTLQVHAGEVLKAAGTQQEREVSLDLPAQNLDQALTAFADQAGLHLLFTSQDVAGRQSPALKGHYSIAQALQSLLAGSGMSWQFSEQNTVILRKSAAAPSVSLKPIEVSVASRT
ncbi:TonB-dependent siderophore receptor, partial [Pseudomonas frederiksbergensis]|nr:TonB-dependent siderophore receptor [Pseudomonas frederiksbergensis]